MLVLTRRVGEGIAIGDDIKVIVMQVKGKQVRLGIKASSSTAVHREEIFDKIKQENQNAANPDVTSVEAATTRLGKPGRDAADSARVVRKTKKPADDDH